MKPNKIYNPIPNRFGEKAISIGQRIRKMRETHTVDYVPTPACYDDMPNNPSKSMDIDVTKQVFKDPYDLSEALGETARKALERSAVQNGTAEAGQAKPEGA